MIIVNDKADEVTSERFRDTAEKIFKKMEWAPAQEVQSEGAGQG